MEKKNKKPESEWFRNIVWTLFSIALLFSLVQLVLSFWGNSFLKDKLLQQLDEKLEQKYQIDVQRVNLNIFSMSITLKELELKPKPGQLDELRKSSNLVYSGTIRELSISGIHPLALFSKKFICSTISILEPHLTLYEGKKQKKKENDSGKLKAFSFKNIRMQNAYLKKVSVKNIQRISEAEKIELSGKKFCLSPAMKVGQGFIKYARLYCKIEKYKLIFDDSLYTLYVSSVDTKFPEESVQIRNLQLKPNHNKYRFSRVKNKREDRIDVSISTLECQGLKFSGLEKGALLIKRAILKDFKFEDYIDLRVPKVYKVNKFPQQSLREAGFPIVIDTIHLLKGKLVYQEQHEDRPEFGEIIFDKTNGIALNVTNDRNQLKVKNTTDIHVSSRLMGRGKLKADFTFFPLDSENRFTYAATLDSMDGTAFNAFVAKALPVKVKSGIINSVKLKAEANNKEVRGQMTLLYRNFYLNIEKDGKQSWRKKILSEITDQVLVSTDNPKKGKQRNGEVEYKRKPDNSIFVTMWKGVLSGMLSTIADHRDKLVQKILKG